MLGEIFLGYFTPDTLPIERIERLVKKLGQRYGIEDRYIQEIIAEVAEHSRPPQAVRDQFEAPVRLLLDRVREYAGLPAHQEIRAIQAGLAQVEQNLTHLKQLIHSL